MPTQELRTVKGYITSYAEVNEQEGFNFKGVAQLDSQDRQSLLAACDGFAQRTQRPEMRSSLR